MIFLKETGKTGGKEEASMTFNRIQAKQDAKAAVARSRCQACIVTAIYLLVTNGVSALAGLFVTNPMQTADQYLETWIQAGGGELDLMELIATAVSSAGPTGVFVSVLLALYGMVMRAGFVIYTMRLSRGEDGSFRDLFEGFQLAPQLIAQQLLITLFTFLWTALALFAFSLAGVAVLLTGSQLLMALFYIGYLFAAVPFFIWVQYRYVLALYFFLDDPNQSVLQSIRSSVTTMKGWKIELLVLDLSMLGWTLLSLVTMGIASVWVMPYTQSVMVNFYDFVTGRRSAWSDSAVPLDEGTGIP